MKIVKFTSSCLLSILLLLPTSSIFALRRQTGQIITAAVTLGFGGLGYLGESLSEDAPKIDSKGNKIKKQKGPAVVAGLVSAAIPLGIIGILSYCFNLTLESQLEAVQAKIDSLRMHPLLVRSMHNPEEVSEMLNAMYASQNTVASAIRAQGEAETMKYEIMELIKMINIIRSGDATDMSFQKQCDDVVMLVQQMFSNIINNVNILEKIIGKR